MNKNNQGLIASVTGTYALTTVLVFVWLNWSYKSACISWLIGFNGQGSVQSICGKAFVGESWVVLLWGSVGAVDGCQRQNRTQSALVWHPGGSLGTDTWCHCNKLHGCAPYWPSQTVMLGGFCISCREMQLGKVSLWNDGRSQGCCRTWGNPHCLLIVTVWLPEKGRNSHLGCTLHLFWVAGATRACVCTGHIDEDGFCRCWQCSQLLSLNSVSAADILIALNCLQR